MSDSSQSFKKCSLFDDEVGNGFGFLAVDCIDSLRGLSFVIQCNNLKFSSLLYDYSAVYRSITMHAINPITEASKWPGSPAFLDAQLTDFALCSA